MSRAEVNSFYREHCIYLPAMAGWFFFSAALSAYNKTVFGKGEMAFPAPLLMTSLHFLGQWIISHLVCMVWYDQNGTHIIDAMDWKTYLWTSVPCGLVTSLDVGLSNLSLVLITITFYTMVKASTPIFVLFWAYCFGIERITCHLVCVVLIIAAGEFLTVYGEVNFDHTGFVLCLVASILSGARWTLVQLKLRSMDPPLKTVFATMKFLAPSMFLSLLLISLAKERPWNTLSHRPSLFRDFLLGLLGASLAVAMVLCEFYLIMRSSAIVLMIGGVIKEMVTIFVGVVWFHDDLNKINLSGCLVVFMGVAFYKYVHFRDTKTRQLAQDLELVELEDPDELHREMEQDNAKLPAVEATLVQPVIGSDAERNALLVQPTNGHGDQAKDEET